MGVLVANAAVRLPSLASAGNESATHTAASFFEFMWCSG
jgi:hypothetical protein